MSNKKIIGIALFSIGIGAVIFLYKGYLKPRLDVDAEANSGVKPPTTNATTVTQLTTTATTTKK